MDSSKWQRLAEFGRRNGKYMAQAGLPLLGQIPMKQVVILISEVPIPLI